MVLLILVIFFVISLLTNILGPIIPDLIDSFGISIGLAGFLPFSFFVAYGVMSLPAGLMVERFTEKPVLLGGFFLALLGAFLFALFTKFSIGLISLFSIGAGMTMLQVVINPLLRVCGEEQNFAFNSVLAQLAFGSASFLSPFLYSYFVLNIHSNHPSSVIRMFDVIVPIGLEWISLYWVFAATSLIMIVVIWLVRFPRVELKEDEKIEVGAGFWELLRNRHVRLYFIAILAYVGTEQGVANWASKFLQIYHNLDPTTDGARVISYFWGLLTLGCLVGLPLLRVFDSRKVLIVFTSGAITSLLFALLGGVEMALFAFPLTGFFASVMWSVIVSLALNSVSLHHGTLSGILCTAIAGGAVVPLIIGGVAELIGLRFAMLILCVTLGYILSVGLWARPIIANATVRSFRELFPKSAHSPDSR